MLFAVNYHYIRDSFDAPYPSIFGVTPDRFRKELRALRESARLVGGEQLMEWAGRDLPDDGAALVVTFDDGLAEQYEHALPVLREEGAPALFFVNSAPLAEGRVSTVHKLHLLRSRLSPHCFSTLLDEQAKRLGLELPEAEGEAPQRHYQYDTPAAARLKYRLNFLLDTEQRRQLADACFEAHFPDRDAEVSRRLYMDAGQIRNLGERGLLGSHAHRHLPLGLLPEPKIREQIRSSLDHLERWSGRRPAAMSYPYGSRAACTPAVGLIAAEEGVRFAFTMERAGNPDCHRTLFLARYANNDLPFDGGVAALRDFFLRKAPAASWGGS